MRVRHTECVTPGYPGRATLSWVIDEVNGSSGSLDEVEAARHLSQSFRATLPPTQFVEVAKQATSAYAPVRFTGFAGRPTATSAIARITTRSNSKIAIYLSLDRRAPHRSVPWT